MFRPLPTVRSEQFAVVKIKSRAKKQKPKNIFVAIIKDPFYVAEKSRTRPREGRFFISRIKDIIRKIVNRPVLQKVDKSRLTGRRSEFKHRFTLMTSEYEILNKTCNQII